MKNSNCRSSGNLSFTLSTIRKSVKLEVIAQTTPHTKATIPTMTCIDIWHILIQVSGGTRRVAGEASFLIVFHTASVSLQKH